MRWIMFIVGWLVGGTAMAMPPPRSVQHHAEHTVALVSHGQQHVLSVFPGPDGLLGAVVENAAGQKDVAWLTPHAHAVLVGVLLDANGADLTRVAKIDQGIILSSAKVLDEAVKPTAHGFIVGHRGPLVTVFFDPNCVFCHQLYGLLAPAIESGRVRVRFVMVGTLKTTSAPRAAAILAAHDPASALTQNESGYEVAAEEGGYPTAAHPAQDALLAVQHNTELFAHAGFVGTPSILYCTKAGTVTLLQGVPADLSHFLASAGTCR